MQPITLDQHLRDGSWALPRIIRRRAPWDVNRIRHTETYYRSERDGTGVDIFFIGSGLDLTHPEISGRAWNIWEHYSSGGLGDDYGHETAVASCAAGQTIGPARGSELFSFKAISGAGATSTAAINAATAQVLSHYNARSGLNRPAIVNMSFGVTDSAISAGVAALIDAGMVVVSITHNHGLQLGVGVNMYPAQVADVIVAGGIGMADMPYYLGNSLDERGTLQIGTNYGPFVDILAPAQGLRMAKAASKGGGYQVWSGTSFSAAYVTGVLACMMQGHGRLTSRAQVQAVAAKLLANATTGKLRSAFGLSPLPDKIVYLDPNQAAPEPIFVLSISGTPVLAATKDAAYGGFTVSASWGTAPLTYSLVGTWPPGITIDPTTGAVSGTPTDSGSFAGLSVRVTDSAIIPATADLAPFTLEVGATATAGPTPIYRHHNFAAAAVSAKILDIAYPTGLAADDILILGVNYDPVGGTGVSLNIPAGFTRIGTEKTAPGGDKSGVFWKRATGGESGNLTVTLNGTLATSRIFSATLVAYQGALQGADPIDAFSEKAIAVAGSANATMDPITTTGANRRVVAFFFENNNTNPLGGPAAGWTSRGSNVSSNGFGSGIFFHDIEQASAGSPVNGSIISNGAREYGIHAFALKPNPA